MKKKTIAFILTAAALAATTIVAAKKQKKKKEGALQATPEEEGKEEKEGRGDARKGQEECICKHSCHCHPVKEAEPAGEDEVDAITLPPVEEIVESVLPGCKKKQKRIAAQVLRAHRADFPCTSAVDGCAELVFEIDLCAYLEKCGILKALVKCAKLHDVAADDLNAVLDTFFGTAEETDSLWEKMARYMDMYTA